MCYCHDKRLRFSRVPARPFLTIFVVVLFFRSFPSKWPSFCISEKYSLFNRNFKTKILENSYPPSQHFFVAKAFSRFLLSRRKVALCQSGRMAQNFPPTENCKKKTEHDNSLRRAVNGNCVILIENEKKTILERPFRVLTIVPLQSLQPESGESGRVLGRHVLPS